MITHDVGDEALGASPFIAIEREVLELTRMKGRGFRAPAFQAAPRSANKLETLEARAVP